jgi:hypothetical protein
MADRYILSGSPKAIANVIRYNRILIERGDLNFTPLDKEEVKEEGVEATDTKEVVVNDTKEVAVEDKKEVKKPSKKSE